MVLQNMKILMENLVMKIVLKFKEKIKMMMNLKIILKIIKMNVWNMKYEIYRYKRSFNCFKYGR